MTARMEAPWEASAWLRDAEARRLEELTPLAREVGADAAIVTGLGGGMTVPGSREDRTCDRCRVYDPPTTPGKAPRYFTAALTHGNTMGGAALLVVGLCRRCADAEGWPERAEVVA